MLLAPIKCHTNRFARPVIAALLLVAGIQLIFQAATEVIAGALIQVINRVIETTLPNVSQIAKLGWRWEGLTLSLEVGTVSLVLGFAMGLWTVRRAHRLKPVAS